jgi:protein-L-isoaspartate(D-aspartate) O-methyltransferase
MLDLNKDRFAAARHEMVRDHIEARGVRTPNVLKAIRKVPREAFIPPSLHEFAYEDSPLPIAEGQTISQPYIVAIMTEALDLRAGERVLEIGTGSGYAAAVLGEIAGEVYTIERHGPLAEKAAEVLADLGYENVHVRHADGTLGWLEHAPFDAIVVTAGGPKVPSTLREQLRVGGRLVIPVGSDPRVQELVRVTRIAEDEYKQEDLADVRFVPLIGEEGWEDRTKRRAPAARKAPSLAETIADRCEAFRRPDDLDFAPLLQRIGDARIVLIGEATHGTSEFYSLRADITRELIEKKGFDFVAIEGDWPDAARIDHYVRHFEYKPSEWTAFARFPTWMWRNREVRAFVDWLREHNKHVPAGQRVAFHGLDLYSLYDSIRSILKYLDDVDPETARIARERYGCLTPWQADPAAYGHAAISGTYQVCENPVAAMLKELQGKRQAYAEHDGERFLDMTQNAQLVANAEKYYRTMYYGSRASWNLRDRHMFATLKSLLDHHGPSSKAVVWAHNSHLGNAEATEMFARGEINLGHLCRNEFGDAIYAIGFGTNTGTVAAASEWGAPMEVKEVRPAIVKSYERLCHDTDKENFLLPLRNFPRPSESESLWSPRLQRAIGVIYRPETEIASHYFQAVLPRQFDEYIWLDRTHAVTPFDTDEMAGMPDTYPFGL